MQKALKLNLGLDNLRSRTAHQYIQPQTVLGLTATTTCPHNACTQEVGTILRIISTMK